MASRLQSYVYGIRNHLQAVHHHNWKTLRTQPLHELSGAFGDLGTFVPIFIAMVSAKQVSAPATLVFSGIANIITGAVFGIPLPVQPMKAIAAIALQKNLNNASIVGAGFFVAGVVGLLSILGLMNWFVRVVPVPVVKGIQVGAGLSLIISAFQKYLTPWTDKIWLVIALLLLLLDRMYRQAPFVLIVVGVSVLLPIVGRIVTAIMDEPYFGPSFNIWHPIVSIPDGNYALNGIFTAGIGQLPLTLLNSVLAVAVLAQDLFPALSTERRLPSAGQIGISVTLMNSIGLWFGSMPFCHGSGGLAAQYRFGARSGASIILLGFLKLLLGVFASDFVVDWCETLSRDGAAFIGILLFLAGLELAKMGQNLNSKGAQDLWDQGVASEEHAANECEGSPRVTDPKARAVRDEEASRRWTVMIVTIGALLGSKNDGIGFAVGMGVHWTYEFLDWRQRRGEGGIRLEDGE